MNGLKDLSIDENKVAALCKKHGIRLLILHGSYAKGKATDKSDIDIGILCEQYINRDKFWDIMRDFDDIFGDRFDPVFLNGVEPMISYHTAISGIPLYEARKGVFAEFKVQTVGRYLDTKKFRELEKEYVKRSVKS